MACICFSCSNEDKTTALSTSINKVKVTNKNSLTSISKVFKRASLELENTLKKESSAGQAQN